MTSSTVLVNERDILLLLRNFLEENGQYECLIPFERSTGVYPPSLPVELVSLREIILWGNLDELQKHIFEPFRDLGEEGELRKCKYAIAKQRYLEALVEVNPDKADMLKRHLSEVDELCPSPNEFQVLMSLLTLPSFADSPEYKSWTVQKGRLECFHTLATWISKVLGANAKLTPPISLQSPEQRLSKSRLVQLITKGLLYERCEDMCAHPHSGHARGQLNDGSKVLDLYNWIKHQPDSAFQLSPSMLQLQINSRSGQSREGNFRGSRSKRGADDSSSQPLLTEESTNSPDSNQLNSTGGDDQQASAAATVEKDDENVEHDGQAEGETELESDGEAKNHESKSVESAAQDDNDESKQEKDSANSHPESNMTDNAASRTAVSTGQVQLARLTPDMMKFDNNFVDGSSSGSITEPSPITDQATGASKAEPTHKMHKADTPSLAVRKSFTSRPSLVAKLKSETDLAERIIREAAIPSTTSAPLLPALLIKETLKFEDNFTDNSGAVEQTPQRHATKKGRKSSTPKPSSSKQLTQQPSPSTSPVPHIPSARGGVSVTEDHSMPTAKKHIDFSENLEESVVFPTARLLAHVTDKQVVRSVAFSKSGSIVAIGANSRTLRLCYTDSLQQENTSDEDNELPVFYHQQHYHKGSVYCMAWWRDSLLVSGSNDQSIRLLSYDPTSHISACTPLSQMRIHKGTIRDLVFTPDGLVVSGGTGDNIIKISNPSTGQVTNTLFGHYDQILGLFVMKENIIASGSQDKTVKLWDLRMGQACATIKLPQSVTSVATNTHLNQIASAQLDGACVVHDLNTLKPVSTYNAHSDECRTVRYSSSTGPSQWLLTGSYDGTVCLADTKTFEWQQVAQHGDKVVQCRWHSSNQAMFASTSADNRACFWKLAV